ncbi:CD3324 family protein [Sporomusa malonica]|uniref:Mor transcription activator family protein n=1 Tax=Sporomusa malonica TaxID=112901 RepID=A0A1W2F1R8_9FIRM|nr:CD3324 family protein [Sporomusa malonica]SMD15861.1 Mor transcription activator family protein [Sporomusa malonica]
MSYKRAKHILPIELLELVQKYVDGECIYIPRKSSNKKEWGSRTSIREELLLRDMQIYKDYQTGYNLGYLSQKYFLSLKSIQRIISQEKRKGV